MLLEDVEEQRALSSTPLCGNSYPLAGAAHLLAHCRLRHLDARLGANPLPDPVRRVPLLARHPRSASNPPPWTASPAPPRLAHWYLTSWRQRRAQCLPDQSAAKGVDLIRLLDRAFLIGCAAVGALLLLIAGALALIAVGESRTPRWQVVLVVLGCGLLVATLVSRPWRR